MSFRCKYFSVSCAKQNYKMVDLLRIVIYTECPSTGRPLVRTILTAHAILVLDLIA